MRKKYFSKIVLQFKIIFLIFSRLWNKVKTGDEQCEHELLFY